MFTNIEKENILAIVRNILKKDDISNEELMLLEEVYCAGFREGINLNNKFVVSNRS